MGNARSSLAYDPLPSLVAGGRLVKEEEEEELGFMIREYCSSDSII